MRVAYTDEQKALQAELRQYFADLITPEIRAATRGAEGGKVHREIIQRMGADGWLGIGWPLDLGGQVRAEERRLWRILEP